MSDVVLCGSLSRHAVTLGADMHEAGYAALGLRWRYVPFEIGEADLPGALAGMRALGIRGFGVSMPFKLTILPFLDALAPVAARIGAANTVVHDPNGRLVGHNTDWQGGVSALRECLEPAGKTILLLGAGGAARALAFGFTEAGARVVVCNRTSAKAEALADAVGAESRAWADRVDLADIDAVVNATSQGMVGADGGSPLPPSALSPKLVVMDAVYAPLETALVRAARAAGATTVTGERMLLHQAARQFELYTEREAPLDAMDAALRPHLATS